MRKHAYAPWVPVPDLSGPVARDELVSRLQLWDAENVSLCQNG